MKLKNVMYTNLGAIAIWACSKDNDSTPTTTPEQENLAPGVSFEGLLKPFKNSKMKLKNLYYIVLLTFTILSCSKSDESEPIPAEMGNSAPTLVSRSFSKPEDISDTEIIGNVQATDDDGDILEYAITSNSKDLFEIADNGDLSLVSGSMLDYEDLKEHSITVSVKDDENEVSAQMNITVENVIENLLEDPNSFITTWETPSAGFELTIGIDETILDYNFTIDWGDGTEESIVDISENITHTYDVAGPYSIAISGNFPAIRMGDDDVPEESAQALTGIVQWGTIAWESFERAFRDCVNLSEYNAQDTPNLSNVESMVRMFSGASSFNGAIGNWNTSNVNDMRQMFFNAESFNQDIGNWNTDKVTNMFGMFSNAIAFNQDISFKEGSDSWNTANVTNMGTMFSGASTFNQPIGNWDTSSVSGMSGMFSGATAFDQNLGAWNISLVAVMFNMFDNSGLSPINFGNTIKGWSGLEMIPQDIFLGVEGVASCLGDTELTAAVVMLSGNGWQFEGIGNPVPCE